MSTKKSKPAIQRVELNTFYDHKIHCPFCGQQVVGPGDDEEWQSTPCPHTLFVATDDGFEFRSARFNEAMDLSGVDDADIDLPDAGYDGLTDQVVIDDALKFAAYVGPPGGMGSYVGFAPLEVE